MSVPMRRRVTMGSPWRLNYRSVGANESQSQRAGHHSDREVLVEVSGAESLTHCSAKAGNARIALLRPSRSGNIQSLWQARLVSCHAPYDHPHLAAFRNRVLHLKSCRESSCGATHVRVFWAFPACCTKPVISSAACLFRAVCASRLRIDMLTWYRQV